MILSVKQNNNFNATDSKPIYKITIKVKVIFYQIVNYTFLMKKIVKVYLSYFYTSETTTLRKQKRLTTNLDVI